MTHCHTQLRSGDINTLLDKELHDKETGVGDVSLAPISLRLLSGARGGRRGEGEKEGGTARLSFHSSHLRIITNFARASLTVLPLVLPALLTPPVDCIISARGIMAPHGVAVTRRLGLVLAVTALMLSACAPRAAAGRQPATSNDAASSLQQTIARLLGLISSKDKPPADPCVAKKCGANAICVKDKGAARCACNVGFSMTPTGCVAA
ncbi:unnamed protein product, partial [Closterium sp. NIES-53]